MKDTRMCYSAHDIRQQFKQNWSIHNNEVNEVGWTQTSLEVLKLDNLANVSTLLIFETARLHRLSNKVRKQTISLI